MNFYDCYALDYSGARRKFMRAAEQAGAVLHAYAHPELQAPDGSPLYVDVAVVGPADAARRLLVVSGTHGLEGLCGSASQVAWLLAGGANELPAETAVVLVHAINPWGFAHWSRTTENNVDLNRNFIDHDQPHPANPSYALLDGLLLRDDWTTEAIASAQQAMEDFGREHGDDALFDCLARGQYSHPQGLNYGGQQREWSNTVLERIVQTHLAGAQQVGFIDWHTGIGNYGEPFFLCFNEEGGPLHDQAIRWWGKDAIVGARPHGRARPNYQGLLFHGVQRFLNGVPMCGAVIEFGTRGWHMRRLLRLDLWLKFKTVPGDERYAMLQADLKDAFNPCDQIWRDSTVKHAVNITRQAVQGLGAWQLG